MVRSLARPAAFDLVVLWMVLPKVTVDVVAAVFDCAWGN
jgi:hypothetical protein